MKVMSMEEKVDLAQDSSYVARPESPGICNADSTLTTKTTCNYDSNAMTDERNAGQGNEFDLGSTNADESQDEHNLNEVKKGKSHQRIYLESLLNKSMKLRITDGRILVGIFLCSDKDRNIILGSCQEHTKDPDVGGEEPRILGLAMVPGRHITAMYIDES